MYAEKTELVKRLYVTSDIYRGPEEVPGSEWAKSLVGASAWPGHCL